MKNLGFTLIEVLVVLSILAVLLSIAPPSFTSLIRGGGMAANNNNTISAFNYARLEAIKRGNSVQLGQRDGNTWMGGIVVWFDANGDGVFDIGEELRVWEAQNNGSTLVSSNSLSSFTFEATGEVNNADVLRLCDNRTGEVGRNISILSSGAIFSDEVNCA